MSFVNKTWRVLIVDDHPLVRDGLRSSIRSTFPSAFVAEAGSAPEALASVSARHPDLVLLDVNLPGENGIDLARRLRAADKRVKLLMVVGEADPWTVEEAIEAGASGFVTKTPSADVLRQAMKAVLEGQMVLCSDAQAALQRAEQRSGTAPEPPGPSVLSEREREILRHLAHGENTKTTVCTPRRLLPVGFAAPLGFQKSVRILPAPYARETKTVEDHEANMQPQNLAP